MAAKKKPAGKAARPIRKGDCVIMRGSKTVYLVERVETVKSEISGAKVRRAQMIVPGDPDGTRYYGATTRMRRANDAEIKSAAEAIRAAIEARLANLKVRQPKALPPEDVPVEPPPAGVDLPRSMTGLSPAADLPRPAHTGDEQPIGRVVSVTDTDVVVQLDPTSPNRPSCPITTDWREEEIMRDITAGRKIGLLLIAVIVLAAVGIFLRLQFGG